MKPINKIPRLIRTATAVIVAGGLAVMVLSAQDDLDTVRQAAEGDATAQFNLGNSTPAGGASSRTMPKPCAGTGWPPNRAMPTAQFYLGVMYANGKGVLKDAAKPCWFHLAAEQGDATAQFTSGTCTPMARACRGLPKPYAGTGWPPNRGLPQHSSTSVHQQGVLKDNAEAVRWYRLAAEQGFAAAQLNLGNMYTNGQGVLKERRYVDAEQGLANAQFMLGNMYASGRGVLEDDAEAVRWYRLAAEQGLVDAQFMLGNIYGAGSSVPQDDPEAARWFRLAAEQGHADAQFYLGVRYNTGMGVLKDAAESVKWFRLAAEQGHADAQFYLGVMYANGKGVLKDAAEAVRWFHLAAEQGDATAQFNLGNMYANGHGVLKDSVLAHMWSNIAGANGNEAARKQRDNLEDDMTRAEISRATELARTCMASDYQDCEP